MTADFAIRLASAAARVLVPEGGTVLIRRDWYEILEWNLRKGCCPACGTPCAGVFEPSSGHWGARRLAVKMGANGIALS